MKYASSQQCYLSYGPVNQLLSLLQIIRKFSRVASTSSLLAELDDNSDPSSSIFKEFRINVISLKASKPTVTTNNITMQKFRETNHAFKKMVNKEVACGRHNYWDANQHTTVFAEDVERARVTTLLPGAEQRNMCGFLDTLPRGMLSYYHVCVLVDKADHLAQKSAIASTASSSFVPCLLSLAISGTTVRSLSAGAKRFQSIPIDGACKQRVIMLLNHITSFHTTTVHPNTSNSPGLPLQLQNNWLRLLLMAFRHINTILTPISHLTSTMA